jgi:hypothetical protein
MVLANELCTRARKHYLTRRGIDDPYWRQEVRISVPFTDTKPDPDGWLNISNLTARVAGVSYSILSGIRTRANYGCTALAVSVRRWAGAHPRHPLRRA